MRKGLIDPRIAKHHGRIAKHHGRIVKTTRDGILVEFGSVVDALWQVVELQHAITEHDVGALEDRRIEFRTGIHLGDIIVEDGDIFGDGVNVAARHETMTPTAGALALSDTPTFHRHACF